MYTKGSDYYTPSHYIKKFLWGITYWTLFRYSPRLLYNWRNFLLRIFGAKIGKNAKVFPSVQIMYPWQLSLGDHSIIAWGVKVYNLGFISIGKETIISQFAHLCAGDHDYHSPDFILLMPRISIGDKVWIATEAFIGPGVTIYNRAIVGARAVVVKDIEESMIVGGNPAKFLKKRD